LPGIGGVLDVIEVWGQKSVGAHSKRVAMALQTVPDDQDRVMMVKNSVI